VFLLPPIIFESGYNMNKVMFFKNIASILALALIGTVISTAVVGVGLWLVRSWFLTEAQHISLIECLVFGALISATDPVTVLAIFKALRVDFNLYSNCFGESVLNDAVAIVLYGTLISFLDEPLTFSSVAFGALRFVVIFVGSILVGVIVALLSALVCSTETRNNT
jgi:NhaP-type Na+/H+ or K+/H+ antiporter